MAEEAHRRSHLLRLLRKKCLDGKLLVAFHRSTAVSVPVHRAAERHTGCSVAGRKAIKTAQKIQKILVTLCLTCCPLAAAAGHFVSCISSGLETKTHLLDNHSVQEYNQWMDTEWGCSNQSAADECRSTFGDQLMVSKEAHQMVRSDDAELNCFLIRF